MNFYTGIKTPSPHFPRRDCKPTKPPFRWLRCLAKTLSWRLCVFALFVIMLRTMYWDNEIVNVIAMLSCVLVPYSLVKTAFYYLHEWVWN